MHVLKIPEIERLIQKDANGKFKLPGCVTIACAKAPLSNDAGDFQHRSFIKLLNEAQNTDIGSDLDLWLPEEMVKDADESGSDA